jgi:hypothetical protein
LAGIFKRFPPKMPVLIGVLPTGKLNTWPFWCRYGDTPPNVSPKKFPAFHFGRAGEFAISSPMLKLTCANRAAAL